MHISVKIHEIRDFPQILMHLVYICEDFRTFTNMILYRLRCLLHTTLQCMVN